MIRLLKKLDFWYTDLSEDSGEPWFSCHLRIRHGRNTRWLEVDRCFPSLRFWRIKLLAEAARKLHGETNEQP